jgi:hypothetical protein
MLEFYRLQALSKALCNRTRGEKHCYTPPCLEIVHYAFLGKLLNSHLQLTDAQRCHASSKRKQFLDCCRLGSETFRFYGKEAYPETLIRQNTKHSLE